MIFPAKEASYLHLYMMQDYIDEHGGLRDPDGTGTMSSREILDAICCLQEHAPGVVTERKQELVDMLKDCSRGRVSIESRIRRRGIRTLAVSP